MRRLIIFLSLILIFLISGCGDQPLTNGDITDGIIIKDFSFDQTEVYSGDYVSLGLEVQNVGEVEGTLTGISIYGGWLSGEETLTIKEPILDPAFPPENIEGDSRYFRWNDKAESVQSETDYQFGVRVKYEYKTEYIGTIRFVKPSYLDTISKEQKDNLISSNGIVSSEVSNGPLNVNPISGRSFIVDSPGGSVSIKFGIKNIGSGYPYQSTEDDYKVVIDGNWIGVSKCYKNEQATSERVIRLSKGEEGTFICDFSVPTLGNYVDRSFKIVFDYSYYTDKSTSITVNPNGLEPTGPSSTTCADLGGQPVPSPQECTDRGGIDCVPTQDTMPEVPGGLGCCCIFTTTSISTTVPPSSTTVPPGSECTVATVRSDCCYYGEGPCQSSDYPVCDNGVCKCNLPVEGVPPIPCGSMV